MDENNWKKRKRALAGLGFFLAFMAVCTLVTRGIYASGMAMVTVIRPEQRTLTHNIVIQGTVRPKQEYGVYVQEGLRVETVFAAVGQVVDTGTPLFQVRVEDLELLIADTETEIRYQQALLEDEDGRRQEEQRERQEILSDLQEDYDNMIRELDIAIEKKLLALEAARQRRELAEETSTSVSGGDPDSLQSCRLAESQAALEAEEAYIRKEETVREWNRQCEEAQRKGYDAMAETVSRRDRLEHSRLLLEKLQELYSVQGVVYAAEPGLLISSSLQAGEYTPDTACMLYVKREHAGIVEFVLDQESSSRLSVGDTVDLEYRMESGEKMRQEGVISYVESRDGNEVAKVELSGAQLVPGQRVTLKYQFVSEVYSTVISMQSVVEEDSRCYVYVVEEQAGFLGMEEHVRKVSVTLVDSNSSLAAVDNGALTPESRIVLGSDRELEDGDVVRQSAY